MLAAFLKTPEPMTVPITRAVAISGPSTRGSRGSGGGGVGFMADRLGHPLPRRHPQRQAAQPQPHAVARRADRVLLAVERPEVEPVGLGAVEGAEPAGPGPPGELVAEGARRDGAGDAGEFRPGR